MSTGFSKSVIPGTHKNLKILWKMFLLTSGGQNVPKSGTGQPKKRGTASATVVLWGVSKRAIWETWGFIFYYSSPLPYNNLFNVKSFIYDSSLCSSGKKITGQVLQQSKVWKPREFRGWSWAGEQNLPRMASSELCLENHQWEFQTNLDVKLQCHRVVQTIPESSLNIKCSWERPAKQNPSKAKSQRPSTLLDDKPRETRVCWSPSGWSSSDLCTCAELSSSWKERNNNKKKKASSPCPRLATGPQGFCASLCHATIPSYLEFHGIPQNSRVLQPLDSTSLHWQQFPLILCVPLPCLVWGCSLLSPPPHPEGASAQKCNSSKLLKLSKNSVTSWNPPLVLQNFLIL